MAQRATHSRIVPAPVGTVLDVALTVEDVLRWFPLPLEAVAVPEDGRLEAGESCVADAHLVGRRVRVRIEILRADPTRFALAAVGPLRFEVDATLREEAGGCRVDAAIEARSGGGLEGRVLEAASRPLLAPGLRRALDRIAELAAAREPDLTAAG